MGIRIRDVMRIVTHTMNFFSLRRRANSKTTS